MVEVSADVGIGPANFLPLQKEKMRLLGKLFTRGNEISFAPEIEIFLFGSFKMS